jgi:predicted esterase
MVKTVSYEHQNTYELLYPITEQTENIWVCFHGLGYLATYFKRYFTKLDSQKNAVIVLQAPSKFYIDKGFKNVGACWLTRIDTAQEIQNNLAYINNVLRQEHVLEDPRLVLFGYSQGVSIATRFLAQHSQPIKGLIMHSGSIPAELDDQTAKHFKKHCDRFIHIVGLRDEYLNDEVVAIEQKKLGMLFGTACEIHTPDITHEVAVSLLEEIAQTL